MFAQALPVMLQSDIHKNVSHGSFKANHQSLNILLLRSPSSEVSNSGG
jgi:hypothetical protein